MAKPPGPIGTATSAATVDTGTKARTLSKAPGPTGMSKSPLGDLTKTRALLIHLDLTELIELDTPEEGRMRDGTTGGKIAVLFKGRVMQKDPKRPGAVLGLVSNKFKDLKDVVRIELGSATGSDRFLKARFGWPLATVGGKPKVHATHGPLFDPSYVGAGAHARSRTHLESFKPLKGDPKKGVTAYVFEGAIGHVIIEFFEAKAVNVNNIFAAAIVHELGHNLGLPHTKSANDIMFVYAGRTEKEQKQWMVLAEKGSLAFNAKQISSIRKLLTTH